MKTRGATVEDLIRAMFDQKQNADLRQLTAVHEILTTGDTCRAKETAHE